MNINLKIYSKNKHSLKKFFICLKKISKKFSLTYFLNFINLKNKKNIFTILKSPHINKTAQEQFQISIFIKLMKIKLIKFNKFLLILKKIQNKLFPDVFFKINFNVKKKLKKKLIKKLLNPNKFKYNKLEFLNYLYLFIYF